MSRVLLSLFLLATLAVYSSPSVAQITLDHTDVEVLIGTSPVQDSWSSNDGQTSAIQVLIDQKGPDQTWDFTGLAYTYDGQFTADYILLTSDVPGAEDPRVENANYAIRVVEMDDGESLEFVYYQQLTESGHYSYGSYAVTEEGDIDDLYDEPLLENVFPLEYGSMWSGSTSYEDVFGETIVSVEVETEGEINGWGTLLLPGRDPIEVLRLEEVRTETETISGVPEPFVEQETNITFISSSYTNASISIDPPPGGIGPTNIYASYTVFGSGGGGTEPPAVAPGNLDPADGATDVPTDPMLSWDAVGSADTYDLQVATDATFSKRGAVDVVVDETGLLSTSFEATGLQGATQYFWRTRAANAGGAGPWSAAQSFTTVSGTAVQARDSEVPAQFALVGNHPNPFNPATTITFDVAESRPVRVSVHDMLGREVAVLVNRELPIGRFDVGWNAGTNPSGTYVVRLETGAFSSSKTVVLLK